MWKISLKWHYGGGSNYPACLACVVTPGVWEGWQFPRGQTKPIHPGRQIQDIAASSSVRFADARDSGFKLSWEAALSATAVERGRINNCKWERERKVGAWVLYFRNPKPLVSGGFVWVMFQIVSGLCRMIRPSKNWERRMGCCTAQKRSNYTRW
jgi:hypothetical protein